MTNTSVKRVVAGLAAAAIVFSAVGVPQLGNAARFAEPIGITAEAASGIATFYDNGGAVLNYATVTDFLADFPDSIQSLRSNGTLVINQDIDLGGSAMSIRQPMTLDLNGHTISSTNRYYTLQVTNSTAVVTITDTSEEGTGGIVSSSRMFDNNNAVYIHDNAKVTFEGGNFESNRDAVRVNNGSGEVVVNGGTFTTTDGSYYGFDHEENSSSVLLAGGTFYGGVFETSGTLGGILQTGKAFYTVGGSAIDQTKNYTHNDVVVKDEDLTNPAATYTDSTGEIHKVSSGSALYELLNQYDAPSGKIEVYEDLDFGDNMLVLQNAYLQIYLNGHSLTWNCSGQGIVVADSIVLFDGGSGSITNTMTSQRAVYVSGASSYAYFKSVDVSGNSAAIELDNSSIATVEGGTISGVIHAMSVGSGTSLTVEDGTFTAINGYGINNSGTLTVNGGIFTGGTKAIYMGGSGASIELADGLGLSDDKGNNVDTKLLSDYSTNTYTYLKAGTSTDVFGGQSLTLTDKVELNIYVKKADLDAAAGKGMAGIDVTVDGKYITPEEQENTVTVNGAECYLYKIPLYSTDMTKDVLFKVSDGDGKIISSLKTSAVDYATQLLQTASVDQATKDTVVSMLNYGAAAQKYFGIKLTNLADKNLTSAQKSGIDDIVIPTSEPYITDNLKEGFKQSTIQYYGSNLTLNSNIGVYHYFRLDKSVDVDTLTFQLNGKDTSARRNSNSNYVQVYCGASNIADMDTTISAYVDDGTEYGTIGYTPLDYLYAASQTTEEKFATQTQYNNFQHLIRALYNYYDKANKM